MNNLITLPIILFFLNFIPQVTAQKYVEQFKALEFNKLTYTCVDSIDHSVFAGTTDKIKIKAKISEACKQGLKDQDSFNLFSNAFNANNTNAVDTILELDGNPLIKSKDRGISISAYDFLNAVQPKTVQQTAIITAMENKFPSKSSDRITNGPAAVDIKLEYWARHSKWDVVKSLGKKLKGVEINKNYEFDDGSNVLMQSIIGNNVALFDEIISEYRLDNSKIDLNAAWKSTRTAPTDVKNHFGINPVGWFPLMLAVGLSRIHMINVLLTVNNAGWIANFNDIDAKILARSLPLVHRIPILDKFHFILGNDADETCKSYKSYAEAISKRPTDEICLNFSSWRYGTANDAAAEAAITHLKPNFMTVVLREWDYIGKRNGDIMLLVWKGLKNDKKSTEQEFKEKFSILKALLSLQLNDSSLFFAGKAPFYEVLSSDFLNENLSKAFINIYSNSTVDDNSNTPSPIILAMKNNNSSGVINFLDTYKREPTSENLRKRFNSNHFETLSHMAIIHMADGADLIKVMEHLIKIDEKFFLEEPSFVASQNRTSYKINGTHEVGYEIDKRMYWTPLMYALALRKNKVANRLLELKANTNFETDEKASPTYIAKHRCDAFITERNKLTQSFNNLPVLNMSNVDANKIHVDAVIDAILNEFHTVHRY